MGEYAFYVLRSGQRESRYFASPRPGGGYGVVPLESGLSPSLIVFHIASRSTLLSFTRFLSTLWDLGSSFSQVFPFCDAHSSRRGVFPSLEMSGVRVRPLFFCNSEQHGSVSLSLRSAYTVPCWWDPRPNGAGAGSSHQRNGRCCAS